MRVFSVKTYTHAEMKHVLKGLRDAGFAAEEAPYGPNEGSGFEYFVQGKMPKEREEEFLKLVEELKS